MADEIGTYKSEDRFGDPVLNRMFCLNTCEWGMLEWGDYRLVAQLKTQKV